MKHAASFKLKTTTNNTTISSLDDPSYLIANLKRKIDFATGQKKADLLVKNASIVNVFSGEIHRDSVAIADGIFVGFGHSEEYEEYDAQDVINAHGKFMCPGLIDGHIHLESTFLAPSEFCSIVALHGTSAVICDPHEIANVLGLPGIDYLLHSTTGLPVKVYAMMPSCVPATSMETSGAIILDKDIHEYMDTNPDSIIGLAEMTLSKLIVAGPKPKDGHAPLVSGKSLDVYIIAGLGSDHECTNLREAEEKLRKGMHIMIRQGTHERNLQNFLPLINDFNSSHISLISDDRSAIDLKQNGHMDYLIRTAISFGLPPIRAIQMASINTARYFGLKNIGAIAPGFRADFIVLDDLESFRITEVFLEGLRLDKNCNSNNICSKNIRGKIKGLQSGMHVEKSSQSSPSTSSLSILRKNTMRIKALNDSNMFGIPPVMTTTSSLPSILVIGVIPEQIITQKRIIKPKINEDYQPIADPDRDIAKLAVVERHQRTGNVGLGFIQGLGLKSGAIASSVAHDSHNLVMAGMNDVDMLTAARHISVIGGGLAAVDNGQVIASLPLPIAGLMSDQNISSVISSLTAVNEACKKLGDNIINDPFMLLSFMSLPVIPSLKLTDKGLVDVDKFEFTNLWVI